MTSHDYTGASRAALALVLAAVCSTAAAQTAIRADRPLPSSTIGAGLLADLPVGDNVLGALETTQAEVIADRFTAAGLNVATAPRFGAMLNSWTQTDFRIGDVSITDPRAGGTPLLLPVFPAWEGVTITTGAMGLDERAPGLSVTLEPLRPKAGWNRSVEGTFAAPPLVADTAGPIAAVDRVRSSGLGQILVSGPLTSRLGLVAAGAWRGVSHVAAPQADAVSDGVGSGFAHVVFAATDRDELRVLAWVERATTPGTSDTAVHVQSTWERRGPVAPWRVFAGFTERSRTSSTSSDLLIDSLTMDPVSEFIDNGTGSARRWVVGARAKPGRGFPFPAVGVDLEGARTEADPSGIGEIRELVGGTPARLWTFRGPTGADQRHLTRFTAYADEQVTAGRLSLDGGVRLDAVWASADAAPRGISWTSWLPRVMARFAATRSGSLALVAGYRRSAYQLPLDVLAIGDPAAPVADVSVWNGTSVGPLVARVGPGTDGNTGLSAIDPGIARPTTDEVIVGVESRPRSSVRLGAAWIVKRERSLLALTDPGVPAALYAPVTVSDPSFLAGSPVGAPTVTALDRPSGSYGRDRYLLTNRPGDPAAFKGLEVSARVTAKALVLLASGAETRTDVPAATTGYLPTQNDQDVLGSLLVDPNAATHARGQVFVDRTTAVKIAAVYHFPRGIRVGAIARYQDGQPFSRVVIVPGLVQGATAVRSYPNGGTAFTYTGTFDLRVQKLFTVGRSQLAAMVDVYNLPNAGKEVVENVVSGSDFRAPTALQPPRTIVFGLRAEF